MPTPTLPTELLEAIFNNLSSSTLDLYSSLLACHAFCKIVKPILYREITIREDWQIVRLRDVREEDKRLVKKVVIIGCGHVRTDKLKEHFEEEECMLLEPCVQLLLEGKLLDISVIETLHIKSMHEDPWPLYEWSAPFDPKPASNLSELSISNHQGGASLWESYLRKPNIPSLRRLAYLNVTMYDLDTPSEPETFDYGSDDGGYSGWKIETPTIEASEAPVLEVDQKLGSFLPYSQFEVLVSEIPPQISRIPNFPFDNFLALVRSKTLIHDSIFPGMRHIQVLAPQTMSNCARIHLLVNVMSFVRQPTNRLTYLVLPTWSTNDSSQFTSDKKQRWFEYIRSKGVEITEEAEESNGVSTSLIPPSFVQYLENNGTLTRK